MKPIWQTIVNIDTTTGACLVKSAKGNIYPADINRLNKSIDVGDNALVVKAMDGSWVVIDVEKKYQKPLGVSDFPRDENNDFNWVEYGKYLKLVEDMKSSERIRFDQYLLNKWRSSQ